MKYYIFVLAVFTGIDLARSQLVFNEATGLYWNPATQIQYVPNSNTPITSTAQLEPIFGPLTLAQQQFYFPYLFRFPPQVALSSLPINENTGIPWDPATGVQFNPTTGAPITTVADVTDIYGPVAQDLLEAYFPYLFPTIAATTTTTVAPITTTTTTAATTTRPQAPSTINPITQLPWDPATGIQYNPFTNLPIVTVAEAQAFFPTASLDVLRTFFPYLFPGTTTTAAPPTTSSPISSLPKNPYTGLPWNPATGIQYNPYTYQPITTVAQVQALYPTITDAQLRTFFAYLFTSTTPATVTTTVKSFGSINSFIDKLNDAVQKKVSFASSIFANKINAGAAFMASMSKN